MRYFSYIEYEPDNLFAIDNSIVVTVSEQELRDKYWPYWYKRMCERFGKEVVDKNYCFEDCLEDWQVVNYAWEVK